MKFTRLCLLLVTLLVLCTATGAESNFWFWGKKDDPKKDDPISAGDPSNNPINTKPDPEDPKKEPKQRVTNELLWRAYQTQLFSLLKRGGDSKGMQLLQKPLEADYTAKTLGNILDKSPKWGAARETRDTRISESYGAFLKNIEIQDSEKTNKEKIANLEQKILSIKKRFEEQELLCRERWEQRKRGDYEAFKERRCYELQNIDFELSQAEFQLRAEKKKAGGDFQIVKDAIAAFNKNPHVWEETFTPRLADFKRHIASGQLNSFSLTITKNEFASIQQDSEWTLTKKQVEEPVVEKPKEDEDRKEETQTKQTQLNSRTHEFTSSTENFKMSISVKGYAGIRVGPSSTWFHKNVISKYHNGPFIDGNKVFWGKEGSLNMIPTQLFLFYKPKVSIVLEREDADYFKAQVNKIVKVGPFRGKCSVTPIDATESRDGETELFKVNIAPEGEAPVIVAIDNQFL